MFQRLLTRLEVDIYSRRERHSVGVHSVLVLVLIFVEMIMWVRDRSTATVWDGEEKLWLGGSGTSTDA